MASWECTPTAVGYWSTSDFARLWGVGAPAALYSLELYGERVRHDNYAVGWEPILDLATQKAAKRTAIIADAAIRLGGNGF